VLAQSLVASYARPTNKAKHCQTKKHTFNQLAHEGRIVFLIHHNAGLEGFPQ
jgi:hypothetical protein